MDPTWTFALPAKSTLWGSAFGPNQEIYLAGALVSPLTLGTINIPSTLSYDILVVKLDGATKKPVWAVTFGGAGDEQAYGIAYSNNAVYITGNTTSASVDFHKSVILTPPAAASKGTSTSYVAKLSAGDGSVVWAISPDQNRAQNTTHFSSCGSIAVQADKILVSCNYNGGDYGSPFLPAPTGPAANAVFRWKDVGTAPQLVWQRSISPALGLPVATFDDQGAPYVAGNFSGPADLYDGDKSATLGKGTGVQNVFAVGFADGTANVTSTQVWTGNSGPLTTTVGTLVATGGSVYLGGWFYGTGGFGALGTVLSKGGADGFWMRTDANLIPQSLFTYGGTGLDLLRGLAADGNGNVYTGVSWGSPTATFGSKALPMPSGTLASAFGKIQGSSGVGVASAPSNSATSYVEISSTAFRAGAIYAVGIFEGLSTFDDGTQATGSPGGSGYLMRRAAF